MLYTTGLGGCAAPLSQLPEKERKNDLCIFNNVYYFRGSQRPLFKAWSYFRASRSNTFFNRSIFLHSRYLLHNWRRSGSLVGVSMKIIESYSKGSLAKEVYDFITSQPVGWQKKGEMIRSGMLFYQAVELVSEDKIGEKLGQKITGRTNRSNIKTSTASTPTVKAG